MKLYPAIDLIKGKAVRLVRGDYEQMTVYSEDPVSVAKGFRDAGAECLHVVDLEGAKTGETPNIELISRIIKEIGLKTEVGGGIRSAETVKKYIDAGVMRVILGTAALTQAGFVNEMVKLYGDKIAVGVDVRDGFVAIRGWQEVTNKECMTFCKEMQKAGVKTIICTDISKDGLLGGANLELYEEMSKELGLDIIASGGVSTIEDIRKLKALGLHGAILGKALYTGMLSLDEAIREVRS